MARVVEEHSAGGVVLIPVGRETFVCLIRVRQRGSLALPKGHIEAGESPEQAALREIREETGINATVLASLGSIDYGFYSRRRRARIAKRVDFFLLEYRSGSPWHFNHEVDGVRLVRLTDAEGRLSHPGERDVMRRALDEIRGWLARP